jgi:hypothetical protein
MQLDHVFVFVPAGGDAAARALEALGFVETYRRAHPGQGTANRCYALENAFLELLWLTDASEATSPPIRRTGLAARAPGGSPGACPFGLAWRAPQGSADPVETWPYRPPYLPPSLSIPVAVASDDPRLPMCFRSPGTDAPIHWPTDRRGALQAAAGLRRLLRPILELPPGSPALPSALTGPDGLVTVRAGDRGHRLGLPIERDDGAVRVLWAPDWTWGPGGDR